jgi:DNA-binding transcriptional LysR family regulator
MIARRMIDAILVLLYFGEHARGNDHSIRGAMDTTEIEVFLVLAEELHFGRTAERLRLPQPQVSRLVARLERRAGGALFDRTSRRVRLTPLGGQLCSQVRPAYVQLKAALDDARSASRGVTGQLRIGFTATTGGEMLTRLVTAFEARHCECTVVLREHQFGPGSWDAWELLRSGEVDVVVNWLAIDEPDLTAGPAIDYRSRVLAVGHSHRLAGCDSVSFEELAGEHVNQVPDSFPQALYEAIVPLRTPSGQPIPRFQPPVQSFHEVMSLVARGRIVHPTMTGVEMFRRADIRLIPLTGLPPLPLGLVWCTAHQNARITALAATAADPRRLQVSGSLKLRQRR